jgi:DNA repair protein RadC
MARWAVDEIIEVPERTILREYGYVPNKTPAAKKKAPVRKRRTKKQKAVEEAGYFVDIPALEPFLGHENLLVRTALVRSKRFPTSRSLPSVASPQRAAHLCYHMTSYDQEYMVSLSTNNQNKVAAIHETAIGGRSGAEVASLDLIKVPIMTSSPAMVVVHNHPSGDPTPSMEDRVMQEKLDEICGCVGLTLLDFVVVGSDGWYSINFAEGGDWQDWLVKQMSKGLR